MIVAYDDDDDDDDDDGQDMPNRILDWQLR